MSTATQEINTKCIICLEKCHRFHIVNNTVRAKLKKLLIRRDMPTGKFLVICYRCHENVRKYFDFKLACLYTENTIKSYLKDSNTRVVDILELYMNTTDVDNRNNVPLEGNSVCRLCLELTECDYSLSKHSQFSKPLQVLLCRYFPEITLNLTYTTEICSFCYNNLEAYFRFVHHCTVTQENAEIRPRVPESNIAPTTDERVNIKNVCSKLDTIQKNIDENGENSPEENIRLDDEGTVTDKNSIKAEEINIKSEEADCGINQETDSASDRLHECEFCNFKSSCRMVYASHLLTHNKCSYQCKKCGHKSRSKVTMRSHMSIHTEELNARNTDACNRCGHKPKYKCNMTRHMLVHKELDGYKKNESVTFAVNNNPTADQIESSISRKNPVDVLCDPQQNQKCTVQTQIESKMQGDTEEEVHIICDIPDSAMKSLTKSRRYKPEKNCCFYCKRNVLSFARHITRHHDDEPAVKKILSLPISSKQRKDLLASLRKKGNYFGIVEHIKPMRKTNALSTTRLKPCPYCMGYYLRLWRHKKICTERSNKDQITHSGDTKSRIADDDLQTKVLSRMQDSHASLVAKNDPLICAFGARYLRTHKYSSSAQITSRKMKELARLLIEIKKQESLVTDFLSALKPQYFDSIVSATKKVVENNKSKDKCYIQTYSLSMGTSIKQCCNVAICQISKENKPNTAEQGLDLKDMMELLESNWKFEVSKTMDLNAEEIEENEIKRNGIEKEVETKLDATKKRLLVPWTTKQKEVVKEFFTEHIRRKKPPKRHECDSLIEKYPLVLYNKNWLKIKVFIQNEYSKKGNKRN